MKRNRLQEAEMAVLLISLFLCKFIIPQSEFITNKKPPIKGRRLPMKAILKTNIIITQKGLSKQSFPENSIGLRAHSLHGAELNQSLEQSRLTCCRYIIPQKKPQQTLRLRPLLP